MTELMPPPVDAHLSNNWMAWLALRHFLTTEMLRRLLHVATERASGGRLRFEMLFEETPGVVHGVGSWLMRPLNVDDRLAGYLQRLIRSVVWRNDEAGWLHATSKDDDAAATARTLDDITLLGVADFSWPADAVALASPSAPIQASVAQLYSALALAREAHATDACEPFWKALNESTRSLEMPLCALATKHIADLCADADVWDKALEGYRQAQEMLERWDGDTAWHGSVIAWKDIVLQSIATALRIVQGPSAAANLLGPAIDGTSLAKNPVLLANASFDSYVLASHPDVENLKARDRRVGQVQSPLLLTEYDDAHAIQLWLNGSLDVASRRFWSQLRRQTALGAGIEARHTKAWYARSLCAQLLDTLRKNTAPETFRLAVRLLIEAESPDVIARIPWSEALIDTYVDAECVQIAISHARRFAGNQRERQLVVTELLKEWIARTAPTNRELALVMWKHIATLARDYPVAFETTVDLGRRALRALKELAEQRPEWRHDVGTEVGEAVRRKLGLNEPWLGQVAALETTLAYVDELQDTEIGKLLESTLARLANLDPAVDAWPLVRPAFQLLLSKPVKRVAREDADVGRRILAQILRFGLEQESENARVFFYLHDFDSSLLLEPTVRPRLQAAVTEVRRRALEIQSTQVTESIYALLLAPAVSGEDGIKDALDGLARVLESAKGPHESLGLAIGYDPLLLLIDTHEQIRAALPDTCEWFPAALVRIISLVTDVWTAAVLKPILFAPFSFPPAKKADAVIVHNWAFASLRLGEEFGAEELINNSLSIASESGALRQAIALARATRAPARAGGVEPLQQVELDDRNAFYMMLGRRLAELHTSAPEPARALCEALVLQCLRFGPRDLDAAVLLTAARMGLAEHVRASGLDDYAQRLQRNRELRMGLHPLVDLFRSKSGKSD